MRYVLRRPLPVRLQYRDGSTVILELVRDLEFPGANLWVLQARKLQTVGSPVIQLATALLGRHHLEDRIYRTGFAVDLRSPALKIMEALERRGQAAGRHSRD